MILANRFLFPVLVVCFLSCGRGSSSAEGERHYQLTGQITALDSKTHVATVNANAIPNFMDAMTMDYPVKPVSEFNSLHTGEKIQATVNVHGDGNYDLSNIRPADK